MSKTSPRGCMIFTCDRRRGNFCCSDCGYRNTNCKNPCLNGPERCGQATPTAKRYGRKERNGSEPGTNKPI